MMELNICRAYGKGINLYDFKTTPFNAESESTLRGQYALKAYTII